MQSVNKMFGSGDLAFNAVAFKISQAINDRATIRNHFADIQKVP